jgi:hypothetical protein
VTPPPPTPSRKGMGGFGIGCHDIGATNSSRSTTIHL